MKLKLALYLSIILLAFYACQEKPNAEPKLEGVWNSVGYGHQLIIADNYITVYDINKNGCVLSSVLPKEFIENYYEITKLTSDSLEVKFGFTRYDFIRAASKSDLCNENVVDDNPVSNFDALWHTFNENYPSFKLRGIDWDTMKEKYRPRLNAQSTDLELYSVLKEMIAELGDGHVSIERPESLGDEIKHDGPDNGKLRTMAISEVNSRYLDNLKTYNKGSVIWGIINSEIGYLQINDFEDLANYQIEDSLSTEEFWNEYWDNAGDSENYPKDVLNGFEKQLTSIFDDIKNTKVCIVDIRFNGGGFDQAGLAVLSHFTAKKAIAFSKKARIQEGFTEEQTIYITPSNNQYAGDLFILTSHQTASASETFVLASLNLTNAQKIGSNTEGVFSDVLSKKLPNGWDYSLSNEVYESADKINYERTGIPADYKTDYSEKTSEFYNNLLEELKTGEDSAIEKVIELNRAKTAQ